MFYLLINVCLTDIVCSSYKYIAASSPTVTNEGTNGENVTPKVVLCSSNVVIAFPFKIFHNLTYPFVSGNENDFILFIIYY